MHHVVCISRPRMADDIMFSCGQVSVGGDDSKVHVYRLAADGSGFSFEEVIVLPGTSAVSALAYSPTGDKIAVGYVGRQVEVPCCEFIEFGTIKHF